jgi:hypothetical protein
MIQVIDIWQGLDAIADCSKPVLSSDPQSVLPTWREKELVRWHGDNKWGLEQKRSKVIVERHCCEKK